MEPGVLRILDANSNRAREALRVIEEHARFVLNDAELAGGWKALRHDLAAVLGEAGMAAAIAFRDTPGDVGTRLATEAEGRRGSAADVVRAAGKRLSEALRALEEYGKTVNSALGAGMEQLRYRGYALEQQHVHVLDARARFGQVRLYVLTTEALCRLPWEQVVRAAAAGGADCFQLREKELDDRALLARARRFRALCHEVGAICIINDRSDIAAAVEADGVHVGQDDLDVVSARRIVGPSRIVGVSTHSVDQAREAATLRPDYVAVGPMFGTPLKPEYGVAGPRTFRTVREAIALPLVAIGGIDVTNVAEVAEAGATCIAVCTAIIGADDPENAARQIRTRLTGPHEQERG